MKRSEFLAQLKKALEDDLDTQKVKEHIDFYDDYIEMEKKKGISETEVIASLGDPWAIAKTILMSEEMGNNAYQPSSDAYEEKEAPNHQIRVLHGWKVKAVIVAIVLVILMILGFAIGLVAAILGLVIRFAVPVLLIVLVIRFFAKK